MSTHNEMAAIRAIFSADGVQTALDLRAAGYREPSPESASYPFLPVPSVTVDALLKRAGGIAWMRSMTITNSHCGQ